MRKQHLIPLTISLAMAGCGELSVATHSLPTSTALAPSSFEPALSPSPTPRNPTPLTTSPAPTVTGMHAPGDLVAVVTTDLVVRSLPGTGDDSVIYAPSLTTPSTAYVIDGPAFADGYEWYLLDPVRSDHVIYGGPPEGWVAAADKDGQPWLSPHHEDCLDRPTFEQFVRLPPQIRLYCYPGQQLEFDVFVDPRSESLIWPLSGSLPWEFGVMAVPESDLGSPPPDCMDCSVPSLFVAYDSDVGEVISLPGAVLLKGHVGDEAATECMPHDPTVARVLVIHTCRKVFVATAF